MQINIYNFIDNGIPKNTARNWMIDLCRRSEYRTTQVRRNFLRRGKLVDTLLFVRSVSTIGAINICESMLTKTNPTVNKIKWNDMLTIIHRLERKEHGKICTTP